MTMMDIGLARSELCAAGFNIDDRPWLIHAAENLKRDDYWADYTGWERWCYEQMGDTEEYYWFEDLDTLEKTGLYAAHCEMVTALEGEG